jgi:excinuclease UvrABC nuclease subunit
MGEIDWTAVARALDGAAKEKQDEANTFAISSDAEQRAKAALKDETADLLRRLGAAIRHGLR